MTVNVKGFVNGHVVFSETVSADDLVSTPTVCGGDIAEEHIRLLMKYVGPDDVCLLDLHFLDDDTHLRIGTDKAAMVDPVQLGEGKRVYSDGKTGWKIE